MALGGTLVQHLPTVARHRGEGHGRAAYVSPEIRVEADPGTTLALEQALSPAPLCTHHQAIGELGAGLRVAARSSDGVIEAVIHESARITGVQWHPEHPEVAAVQLTGLLRRLASQLPLAP